MGALSAVTSRKTPCRRLYVFLSRCDALDTTTSSSTATPNKDGHSSQLDRLLRVSYSLRDTSTSNLHSSQAGPELSQPAAHLAIQYHVVYRPATMVNTAASTSTMPYKVTDEQMKRFREDGCAFKLLALDGVILKGKQTSYCPTFSRTTWRGNCWRGQNSFWRTLI